MKKFTLSLITISLLLISNLIYITPTYAAYTGPTYNNLPIYQSELFKVVSIDSQGFYAISGTDNSGYYFTWDAVRDGDKITIGMIVDATFDSSLSSDDIVNPDDGLISVERFRPEQYE